MPRQENYQEDIANFSRGEGVDRVVIPFIYERTGIPTDFAEDLQRDFVEFNFYDLNSNALLETVTLTALENYENNYIYRRVTPDTNDADELVVRTSQMVKDGVLRLSPGYYNVVVNFFSHEVGRVYSRPLRIVEGAISNSRKEIVVEYPMDFTDEERAAARNEIREFVVPSMDIEDLIALVKQIFRDSSDETATDVEELTASDITQEYSERNPTQYQVLYNSPYYKNEAMITTEETEAYLQSGRLGDKLPTVYYFLYEELLQSLRRGDRRIQMSEMSVYIRNAIRRAYAEARSRFPNTVQVN